MKSMVYVQRPYDMREEYMLKTERRHMTLEWKKKIIGVSTKLNQRSR